MDLRFAYHTSGASWHRLDDALGLIAEAGYAGVALTPDHHHFDPSAPDLGPRADRLCNRLRELGLGLVVDTDARYLLDPRRPFEPSLVSPEPLGRARRVDHIARCLDIAAACDAETVSFRSGGLLPGVGPEDAMGWLEDGIGAVLDAALVRGISASLEPEPGLMIETVDDWKRLHTLFPSLRLALDVGHLLVTGERDPTDAIFEFAEQIGTVALEDTCRGVHEHLPFGEGDMDLPGVLRALHGIAFDRLICVDLPRESHRAHTMVPDALRRLEAAEREVQRAG